MELVRRSAMQSMLLWLILVTVLAHALLPVGSPIIRTTGSAFSATTADVALRPWRKDKATVAKEQQGPSGEEGGVSANATDGDILASAESEAAPVLSVAARPTPPFDGNAAATEPIRAFRARAPPLT